MSSQEETPVQTQNMLTGIHTLINWNYLEDGPNEKYVWTNLLHCDYDHEKGQMMMIYNQQAHTTVYLPTYHWKTTLPLVIQEYSSRKCLIKLVFLFNTKGTL